MRVTPAVYWNKWMRNGRKPARPPYRFKECKELVLKDSVGRKSAGQAELACNAQMLEMLNCFKSNEFDQSICAPQVTAFKDCYQQHLEKKALSKTAVDKDEPVPGQRKLTMQQVNSLLSRWPQPR